MSDPSLKVLVVEDSRTVGAFLSATLRGFGYACEVVTSGAEALDHYSAAKPDLILLDVMLPDMEGFAVAERIRRSDPESWVPIIFLTSLESEDDLSRGIEVGGDDYLTKPVSRVVLKAKIHAMERIVAMRRRLIELTAQLSEANKALARQSEEDALTGLANRRMFDLILSREIEHSRRTKQPLTLALFDVDYFKRYNDALGHTHGDQCLREVAQVLRRSCRRATDLPARYGGEEFALILPNTPRSGARLLIQGLARLMAGARIAHPDSPLGEFVTVSGGMTTVIATDSTTPLSLVRAADEALYAAKGAGRNRVIGFDGEACALPVQNTG
jgi:diguanylate cyclase (GGDEF)-like protein